VFGGPCRAQGAAKTAENGGVWSVQGLAEYLIDARDGKTDAKRATVDG